MIRCSNYTEHYRLDAEQFDYFTNQDPTDAAYETLFRKFIIKLAGKHRTVVDIGSGSGWTTAISHEQIFFVDLSRKNLAALKSESAGAVMADAHHLPFKDQSLELLTASEIIEHLNEPEVAAREIWRVLKPGGKAIVSTPYKEKIRYTLCIHCNQVTPWNAHLHSFDRERLFSYFPEAKRMNAYRFGSKILSLVRAPRIFRYMPLWVWRAFDCSLIRLVDKAQHVVVVIEKEPAA